MKKKNRRKGINLGVKELNAIKSSCEKDKDEDLNDLVYIETVNLDKDKDWVGPVEMTQELILFAETYFWATGKNRSYSYAARVVGYEGRNARVVGHRYSKYSLVRNYWLSLESQYSSMRRSMHISALKKLEDIAYNDVCDNSEAFRVQVLSMIADKTMVAMDGGVAIKDSNNVDSDTQSTMQQLMASIQALGGNK